MIISRLKNIDEDGQYIAGIEEKITLHHHVDPLEYIRPALASTVQT